MTNMANEPDYYAILGVQPATDDESIRQAYRRLAWEYHPDRAGDESAARMSQINVAYQVLGDPERRARYDAQRPDIPRKQGQPASTPNGSTAAPRAGMLTVSAGPLALLTRFDTPPGPALSAVAFTHDGLFVGGGQQDGHALIWSLHTGRLAHTLTYSVGQNTGVLQELRLSPRGTLAAAWGGLLGLRVWSVADGQAIWNTNVRAPVGAMDAILLDDPPLIRLATPDAPLALANDDPVRFVEQGRRGTAVFARPLVGQVSPIWATPFHCTEGGAEGTPRESSDADWRMQQRWLSSDGAFLATFGSGAAPRFGKGSYLRLWSLLSKTLLGATEPKRIEQIMEPPGILHPPFAATHDLTWIAVGGANRHVRLFALRARQQRTVEIGRLPKEALLALAPDGERLALARESRLDVYDTRSQKMLQTWEFAAPITALTYSTHAARPLLGVGLRNGVLELWG